MPRPANGSEIDWPSSRGWGPKPGAFYGSRDEAAREKKVSQSSIGRLDRVGDQQSGRQAYFVLVPSAHPIVDEAQASPLAA